MSDVVLERNTPNWPEKYEFKLPTLSEADMSKDNQGALLVTQATTIIVCDYLRYGIELSRQSISWDIYRLDPDELVTFINNVQDAQKSF